MNTPPTRRKWNPLSPFIVVPLFLACLYITLFVPCTWITGYTLPIEEAIEETLILPVNTEIFTTNLYSGVVTITISGQGQIDSRTHSAFTIFNPVGYNESFYGFTIDGEPLILRVFVVAPTPTNPLIHQYRFSYYVEGEARRIKFLIDNGNPEDNSTFVIDVTSRNLLVSPGR